MSEQARVRFADDTLVVGGKTFPAASLRAWAPWSAVEAAALRLNPPVTPGEIEVLGEAAAAAGPAALNGFAELKSALSRTRKVGRDKPPGGP